MSGNLDLDIRTPQPVPPATVPIADANGLPTPSMGRFMRLVGQRTGMGGGVFAGMPKVGNIAIGTVAPSSFGSMTFTFATPWPNFAETIIVSSSNASIIVAARDLTLADFLLVWQNTSTTTALTDIVASIICYGG
jgi:hypothetical protein